MKLKQQKNRLKPVWFYLAMAMFAFLPLYAVATDSDSDGIAGTELKYSGTILDEPSCSVDAPEPVNLGTWMTSASSGLGSAVDQVGTVVKFSITANCTEPGFHASLWIDANTITCGVLRCIRLDAASGAATGVAIQMVMYAPFYVYEGGGGAAGDLFYDGFYSGNDGASEEGALLQGDNELKFGARYYQIAPTITAGTANATATFNFRFTK